MSRIRQLPESLANKIAAGEVVQRPESIVKELVENSIDAGATSIAVAVRAAGKALVMVADNGGGMDEDDARLAFNRHATSKIAEAEDLDRILTLGFRGEALAAIASVAQVELRTRRAEDELGTLVRVENGAVLEVGRTACERGTTILVRNLFFSVPARRKFLKSNATEFKHIVETMQRFALCRPEVSFTLSDDDTLVLNAPAGTMEDRIRSLYNEEFMNGLLPFEAVGDGVRVHGYVGRPNFARRSRGDQFLFLNGRSITSRLLSHAVYLGYEHLTDAGSYPPYILFVDIDPERVDVNVHPTKQEVKFDDESSIYDLLLEGTRRALAAHNLTPAMTMPGGGNTESAESVLAALRFALPGYDRPQTMPTRQTQSPSSSSPSPSTGAYDRRTTERPASGGMIGRDTLAQLFGAQENEAGAPGAPANGGDARGVTIEQEVRPVGAERESAEADRHGIWQVHNKYILSQIRSGIMIVDQHVAHERILYERAVATMKQAMPMAQQLLFPLELKLSPADFALVREIAPQLAALGFDMAIDRGADRVTIMGVPNDVRPGQEGAILGELLDQYREYQQVGATDQQDLVAASFACRASIKAGDRLSEPEMLNLIDQLFATSMPYVCPHGRPIVIRIDLAELDRRFGRTS